MSTSPEDRIVTALSRWLARHVNNAQLRQEVEAAGSGGLSGEQAGLVDELLRELERADPGERASLEPLVRETLEALVLGG